MNTYREGKKIIVVDDEPEVAELMKLFLEGLGYQSDIFSSCEEAIKAIETNKYWAAFCDYILPSNTGDKVYYKIRGIDNALSKRFVIITGALFNEMLNEFLTNEKVKVINKPFMLDEIKQIIEEFEEK